jgi:hypothetical protein
MILSKSNICGWSGADWHPIKLDEKTDAQITITYAHHEIHNEKAFTVSDVQSCDTTTIKWQIQTPNDDRRIHMLWDIECTGELYLVITEGSDRTGTNLLTSYNRNRNSKTKSGCTIHRAVSGGSTDGATTIRTWRGGATGVASKVVAASGMRGSNEWILKKNTKYVISATTYSAVYVSVGWDWYEHINA